MARLPFSAGMAQVMVEPGVMVEAVARAPEVVGAAVRVVPLSVEAWAALTPEHRADRCKAWHPWVSVVSALPDGNVTVRFNRPVPASKRGSVLMAYEDLIRQKVAPHLIVWHEPLGDRNSLRNLRGIEVKS